LGLALCSRGTLGKGTLRTYPSWRVPTLTTGCVSPQYHCRFDDFFETTRHGGPDVSGTISWQQLAGLDCATMILPEVSAPIQHSVMYLESLSEGDIPPEEPSFSLPVFDVTLDNYSISDGDSHVTENNGPSRQSRASLQAELSILSLLVPVNVDGSARCHEEWPSQSHKSCIM